MFYVLTNIYEYDDLKYEISRFSGTYIICVIKFKTLKRKSVLERERIFLCILHYSFVFYSLSQNPGFSPSLVERGELVGSILKYYAQKSVTALIDNSLQRFLKFHTGIGGHMIKLVAKSLVDKLVKGFAENI